VKRFERSGETFEATLASVPGTPGRVHLRPVLLTIAFMVLFFGVVGLALYLKPFGDSPPSGKPELDIFAAGPVKEFAPGTITYFQKEHLYLVHFTDGAFLALYDLSPATQTAIGEGDATLLQCRAALTVASATEGDSFESFLGADVAARGFPSTAFVNTCSGAIWDAEGTHVGGPGDGRLDRFPIAVINDIVRIDLADRRCEATASPCSPTQ
jgi:hypothetical protein